MKKHSTIKLTDKKRILFVDDDMSFLTSLAEGLSDDPMLVISSASNGKEAIDLIEVSPFDMIITDVKMPTMGGFELVAYLGRNHPEIPVIVMTAFGTPDMEVNLRLLGVSHYIEKPIDVELLGQKIRDIFEKVDEKSPSDAPLSSTEELMSVLYQSERQKVHGEVIVTHTGSSGRFFFYQGKIAWISVTSISKTLVNHIVDNTDLKIDDLKAVFEESKKSGHNFGEKIVEWGLLKPNTFRELLKDYISEGFCEILFWKNLKVMFVPDKRSYQGRFLFGVEELFASAQGKTKYTQMTLKEQREQAIGNKNVTATKTVTENKQAGQNFQTPEQKREVNMSEIREAMEKMKAVDGFMGAAAFSAAGELIEEVVGSAGKMSELGALANDVLLKSQKTTDIMGVGRGNMIHITAPKANILVRCLNENTDFAANEPGRAHIHMMIIIEPEGNLALARMRLEKAIQEAAPSVR